MSRVDVGRLWRTVRHLRREQVFGQLRRALRRGADARPRRASGTATLGLPPAARWLPPAPHVAATTPERLVLIGTDAPWSLPVAWDGDALDPLGRFHLHYCEWVRAAGLEPALRLRVLSDWVERYAEGPGWGPAPTSLRTFAWLKLLTTPGALPDRAEDVLLPSLADQLTTLEAGVEVHLLANHYLSNLLALVAGGVGLRGTDADRWLARAPALVRELDEEFPADGAHYERSPMYHAELLERVLDVLNLVRGQPDRAPVGLESALDRCAARALRALRVWSHPDGRIALFADAALDVTAEPAELAAYAAALGVREGPDEPPGVLDRAGFVRLTEGPFTLIASVAGPAPAYQPGHAHCDALSFELSVGTERVVTDTGVYEYAPGARRDLARATTSHATLQIEGREQSEIWAAHRIGGRARVELEETVPGRRAVASCRGWATPGIVHRRSFEVAPGVLRIVDRLSRDASVVAVLPLAPGLVPEVEASRARIRLAAGVLDLSLPGGLQWRRERTPYFPSYGRAEERWALVGEAPAWRGGAFELRVGAASE